MEKLPDELTVRVAGAPTSFPRLAHLFRPPPLFTITSLTLPLADFLDAGRSNSLQQGAYQRGLSSLSRLNKRFHRVVLPLLFSRPVLITPDQVETWTRTYTSFVDPFKRAAAGRAWPPKLFKPESVRSTPSFPLLRRFDCLLARS